MVQILEVAFKPSQARAPKSYIISFVMHLMYLGASNKTTQTTLADRIRNAKRYFVYVDLIFIVIFVP